MGGVERRHNLERRRCEFPETRQEAQVLRVERPDIVVGHGPDRPDRLAPQEEWHQQALMYWRKILPEIREVPSGIGKQQRLEPIEDRTAGTEAAGSCPSQLGPIGTGQRA